MIRLYLIIGALFLAALAYQTHRANSAIKANAILTVERNAARWQVEQEQKARKHEQEIARDASNQFQRTVVSLQTELAGRPLKPVVIRVRDHQTVPAANGAAGTAAGPDAAGQGRIDQTVEVDIAPGLTQYALDCQANSAQLDALQGWVRSR